MTAVSISTSHRYHARYRLCLFDQTAQAACSFALFDAATRDAHFDLSYEGAVHESHSYGVELVSEVRLDVVRATLCVNDEETWTAFVESATISRSNEGSLPESDLALAVGAGSLSSEELAVRASFSNVGETDALPNIEAVGTGSSVVDNSARAVHYHYHLTLSSMDNFLFRMTYGFARIELNLQLADGSRLALITSDIACACDNSDQRQVVSRILDELTSEDAGVAINWMLMPAQSEELGESLVQSSSVVDSSKSLQVFLLLCEEVIKTYDLNLNYFRANAYHRIVGQEEIVRSSAVRRFGRRELSWLASSADTLYETKSETAIKIGDRSYMASQVRTSRPRRSYDNRENRAVLAFISEVARRVGDIEDKAQRQAALLEEMKRKLQQVQVDEGLLPALMVVDVCLRKERPLIERALLLRKKAHRLALALAVGLPQVKAVHYRLPRRTKVFQEIKPYADVHECMRRWDEFGEFAMLRDGLVLHTWRMDKLYEYYVLYRLLQELSTCGFSLSSATKNPAARVAYTLQSRYFENENQVANVYHLSRGAEKLTVFYEPVVYGDQREEHGVQVHRLTRNNQGLDSYWTPDYLLQHECEGVVRRVVLDAKFRSLDSVWKPYRDSSQSTFDECLNKYCICMIGSDGKPVEAVWLLCGRVLNRELRIFQDSSWAAEQQFGVPSGVASVSPDADALHELLDNLRLV